MTISRPDICSSASDPSSGILILGTSAPGTSKVNSSTLAEGSRSDSSRRMLSIPARWACSHSARDLLVFRRAPREPG